MTRRIAATLLLALTPIAAIAGRLDRELERFVREAELGSSVVGIAVMDPTTQQMIGVVNENQQFIPASNQKLFSSGAALSILGPDFQFETVLSVLEPTEAGGLPSLLVTASGDPAFADPKLLEQMGIGADELLQHWVEAAAATGFEQFDQLIIDARIFDRELVHPNWPPEQLNRWYCAEVDALNFHSNLMHLFIKPTVVGQPPTIESEPDLTGIRLSNRARTVRSGNQTTWAARAAKTNNITVFGNARRAAHLVEVTTHDNANLFASYLRARLSAAGLRVESTRLAEEADEFDSRATPIHVIRTPLSRVLTRINADSYNLYAEALLKRIAHEVTGEPGSFSAGNAVVRMTVQPALIDASPATLVFDDGSGMSRDNRATPRALAEWLSHINQDARIAQPFIDSLATPSNGTRTVRRLASVSLANDVHAKSGYLKRVYSLSGYLRDPETKRTLAFAILINDKPNTVPAQRVHDLFAEIVQRVDQELEQIDPPVARQPSTGGDALGG